jgi:hypothetical protein
MSTKFVMESYMKSDINTLKRGEVRQIVCAVQGIAHQERVGGRFSQGLVLFLNEFHKEVTEVLHAENNVFSFIDNTKLECIDMIQEAIRVHLIGFYRSYKGEIEGSLFDINIEGSKEKRGAYILELTSIVFEHIIYIQKNTKSAMRAAQNLGKYYDSDFTKEYLRGSLIEEALKKEGVEMSNDQFKSVFTETKRLHFLINNIVDPVMAMRQVGKNLREVLTDKNIKEALKKEGVEMSNEELQNLFTESKRLRFSVSNIADPLMAIQKVGKNLKKVLTDANIAKALKEEGVTMDKKELQRIFTDAKRLHFAIHNIAKPLMAVRQVGKTLRAVLTDANIAQVLKEEGVTMDKKEFQRIFTDAKRLNFSINNISNPLIIVRQVGKNLREVLTDTNIEKILEEEGMDMNKEDMQNVFTDSKRLYFAINNIANPLGGIKSWIRGDICVVGNNFLK